MLVIRHGEKVYGNNIGLDSPLKKIKIQFTREAIKSHLEIIEGCIPDKIYSSPLLRCRQTANILQKELFKKYEVLVPIKILPILGEYFGNQKELNLSSITEETKKFYKENIIKETYCEFLERVSSISFNLRCCYVTHGLVIKKSIEFLLNRGYTIDTNSFYPSECMGFSISKKTINKLY